MSRPTVVGTLCLWVLFLMGGTTHAQEIEAAFGVHTLTAPSAASASGNYSPQSLRGGAFASFSGDFLFVKNQIGIHGEVSWRANRSLYQGVQPFRPMFYDFNAIWAPRLAKSVRGELTAGIGVESTRFYQDFFTCSFAGCTNYVSVNHFMGHFGGGIRFYLTGHVFIRPEAHLYLIRHNFEFSSARAARFGGSIGYTLGSPE